MRFQLDYDLTTIYHIHSQLSLCSKDPEQNLENILRIAKDLGLRPICLADHRGRQCQTLLQRAASSARRLSARRFRIRQT